MLTILWIAALLVGALIVNALSKINTTLIALCERAHVIDQAILFLREDYGRESLQIRSLLEQIAQVKDSN